MWSGTSMTAGKLFRLQTASGSDIITIAPPKTYSCVVICSPKLSNGTSYTILTGGSCTGTIKDYIYSGGTYSGGTQQYTFTISSILTTLGTASGGGMGGNTRLM